MNTFSLARELEKSVSRTDPEIDTSEAFRAAREVLLQGLELLFELRDQTYSHASFITGMSIGQHYGQVIQHFRSLIQGCRDRRDSLRCLRTRCALAERRGLRQHRYLRCAEGLQAVLAGDF
jgi:hypothetical protein